MAIDLNVDYDAGYFDKDEQGWCARRVQVTSDGERVTIRRSGDDNGLRNYDETVEGRVGRSWPELGLVQIVCPQESPYFDANTRRLRPAYEQMSTWFVPPAGLRGPGCLPEIVEIVAAVAEQLGRTPGRPPPDLTLPAPVPNPHCMDALESRVEVTDERGCSWELMVRDFPPGEWTEHQVSVRVQSGGVWSSVFVQEPRKGHFLFMGPLELYHLAAAARDRLLAAWCGT